eukprot:c23499_g1_i1 orf=547-1650(+)
MGKPTKASGSSSPWDRRVNGAGMSCSEIERSQRERTRRTHRNQDPCNLERLRIEREAATSSQTASFDDLQDPLCNSPCKRRRRLLGETKSSRNRVPLVEIRGDSWADASCAPSSKYAFLTTKRDGTRPSSRTHPYNDDSNIYVTRQPRRSAAGATTEERIWDRPESNNKQNNGAHQPNPKPRAHHKRFETDLHELRIETGLHELLGNHTPVRINAQTPYSNQGVHADLPNRISCRHLLYRDMTTKQSQRRQVWEFACALAHEYLNRKYSKEDENAGQAYGAKWLSKESWESDEKTTCSGDRTEMEIRRKVHTIVDKEQEEQDQQRLVPLETVCMDDQQKLVPLKAVSMNDVVNPLQAAAAAWLRKKF